MKFNIFKRELNKESSDAELIKIICGACNVRESDALKIPSVSACVSLICDTISSLKVKLYERDGDNIKEITDDKRTRLINDDTGDTLDGVAFKRAMVRSYLLSGAAYAFINKRGNNIKSLHYLENDYVNFNYSSDPIFKSYDVLVDGHVFRPFDVLTVTKATKNGYQGQNTIVENDGIFSAGYNTIKLQEYISKSGGTKAGFLTSERTLTPEAMDKLKADFQGLYSNQNERKVVILNNGLKFEEAASTSQELQMNENKKTNNLEINSIFHVPYAVLYGEADDDTYDQFLKNAITPILTAFECAFNKYLLLEKEKDNRYFAFDTSLLFKGSMLNRFSAYATAIDKGIMQVDEVRKKENLNPLGMKYVKIGLSDVLYDPNTNKVFTPNTGTITDLDAATATVKDNSTEGGDNDAKDGN